MVNFEKLVEEFLLEAPADQFSGGTKQTPGGLFVPSGFSSNPQSQVSNPTKQPPPSTNDKQQTPVEDEQSPMPEAFQMLEKYFDRFLGNDYTIPWRSSQLKHDHIQTTLFVPAKGTKYEFIKDFVQPHYPYIDFLCYLNEVFKKTNPNKNLTIDLIPKLFKDEDLRKHVTFFIEKSNFNRNSPPPCDPIRNYIPMSERLRGQFHQSILQALLSTGAVGQSAIANFIKNKFTLSQAINNVISLRSQKVSLFNSSKTQNKELDNTVANYQKYAPGGSLAGRLPSQIKSSNIQDGFFKLCQEIHNYANDETVKKSIQQVLSMTIQELQNNKQASQIIFVLKELANFIPENPSLITKITGIVSGLGQIAKGLSLGVPTMGR
jgi:hypothetical protein